MLIDVYKSVTNSKKYLSVPAGTDVLTKSFPSDLDSDLHKLSPFKSSIDVQPNDGRIGMDSADIIRQIEERGYATHGTDVIFTITVK